jgi:hypothetical protein
MSVSPEPATPDELLRQSVRLARNGSIILTDQVLNEASNQTGSREAVSPRNGSLGQSLVNS